MGVHTDFRLFESSSIIVPPHEQKKNVDRARDKGVELWDYQARVLYATTGELIQDPKLWKILEPITLWCDIQRENQKLIPHGYKFHSTCVSG